MKVKNILLSHLPIPTDKIGSWNVLFSSLIFHNPNIFDYIISPKIDKEKYHIPNHIEIKFRTTKLNKLIKHYDKIEFWNVILKLLKKDEKLVLNIIDNIGLLIALDFFAKKHNLRDRLFLNFFLRGYNFDVSVERRKKIYSAINKLIVMSNSSYEFQIQNNHELSGEVEILKNGVETNKFYPLNKKNKTQKRKELMFNPNKTYFLWLSQDRPKKGLSLILLVWKEIIKEFKNVELLIIGSERKINQPGVLNIGRIKNSELPKYYQIADYFLFSSLCHEGHPLALTEALKCGLKCFASNIDPISEVLQNGKLGILVKQPHFKESWVLAITNELKKPSFLIDKDINLNKLYSFEDWLKNVEKICKDSINSFNF